MKTYKIVRQYRDHSDEVIETGLTLQQARAHCQSPETSWRTCTTLEGRGLTQRKGPWFDGFEEEKRDG